MSIGGVWFICLSVCLSLCLSLCLSVSKSSSHSLPFPLSHIFSFSFAPTFSLFLNGEFWGVYGIREKGDEHYIENNHSVDNDEVDLLNSFGVLEGSDDHFIDAVNDLLSIDANNPVFYDMAS